MITFDTSACSYGPALWTMFLGPRLDCLTSFKFVLRTIEHCGPLTRKHAKMALLKLRAPWARFFEAPLKYLPSSKVAMGTIQHGGSREGFRSWDQTFYSERALVLLKLLSFKTPTLGPRYLDVPLVCQPSCKVARGTIQHCQSREEFSNRDHRSCVKRAR